MRPVEQGVSCPGCPHRAAYVACREALGRGRGRVICGNAGCPAVGFLHPAATVCPGGENELLPRYKKDVPQGSSAAEPAVAACIHMTAAEELMADDAPQRFAALACEGTVTVLAVLASSKHFMEHDALEALGVRALELGIPDATVVDPFDTVRAANVMTEALAIPGVHAVIFAAPCVRLLDAHSLPEPVEIDRFACVGCHRCKQISGCPALLFTPPTYTVDADACTGCDLCTALCRTHVIYSARVRLSPAERAAERRAAVRAGSHQP